MLDLRTAFLAEVDNFIRKNPDVKENTLSIMATGQRYLIAKVRDGGNAELETCQKVLNLIHSARQGVIAVAGVKGERAR